jgi:predicted transcriptional regulator
MTTMTLELTDEQAKKWTKEAERLNMTPEQLVTRSVEERLSGRKRYMTQAIKRIIKDNEELYRRLA